MARPIAFSSEVGTGSRQENASKHRSSGSDLIRTDAQLPSNGSRMKGFLLPLAAAGGPSEPKPELNTPGWAARSASESGTADCDDALAAFGGKSRPPLRPQPASANAVTLSRMMAHPDDVSR